MSIRHQVQPKEFRRRRRRLCGHPQRRRGEAEGGGGHDRPRLGGHRRLTGELPVLLRRRLLRRELLLEQPRPRGELILPRTRMNATPTQFLLICCFQCKSTSVA